MKNLFQRLTSAPTREEVERQAAEELHAAAGLPGREAPQPPAWQPGGQGGEARQAELGDDLDMVEPSSAGDGDSRSPDEDQQPRRARKSPTRRRKPRQESP